MARNVTETRRRANDRRRAWALRNKSLLGLGLALVLGIGAAQTAWILLLSGGRLGYYVLGATHAGIVAMVVAGLHTAWLLNDGEGARQLRGAIGEENTADELRKATRRGLIWGAVHDVRLQRGDLDHVVVTKRGGLVVLDSKWRSDEDLAPAELAHRARQVRLRADALVDTLVPRSRGSRSNGARARVRPAVVVWGSGARSVPRGFSEGGVDVVAGRDLRAWLDELDGHEVSEGAALAFLDKVREFSERVRASR